MLFFFMQKIVKKQGLDMDCLFYSMHLHSNANVHEL